MTQTKLSKKMWFIQVVVLAMEPDTITRKDTLYVV